MGCPQGPLDHPNGPPVCHNGAPKPLKCQVWAPKMTLSSTLPVLPVLPILQVLPVLPVTSQTVTEGAGGRGEALIYIYIYIYIPVR